MEKLKVTISSILLFLFICSSVHADEGMWMLGNLNKQTRKAMKELGLQMSADELYHPQKSSLKDAIVSFGDFCSGVVVSEEGLVFTNHHCGFNSIQQHSSLENDYIKNGFIARNRNEELPNPELYVRFLLRTENVSSRILKSVCPAMTEEERATTIDSVMYIVQNEVSETDSTLIGIVDAYYGGNEFWLSVYRDFNDVRLVFAPPSSVGKFGGDTDNWMWPRHTGDFCIFRIYADKNNQPADYSDNNIPYRPPYVVPISLEGYEEGSFCMTLGYPGITERYLSSFGIEEMMNDKNQAIIDARSVKQAIWKREMDRDTDIRIKYAAKYAESSNYWKNSIGMNSAIRKLKVLEKKRTEEAELLHRIQNSNEAHQNLHLLSSLELNYKNRQATNRAMMYFGESFANGPELMQFALEILSLNLKAEEKYVSATIKKILGKYSNFNSNIDKEVFTAMLKEYRSKVDSIFLPDMYHTIDHDYGGDDRTFVDSLYAHTDIITPNGLKLFFSPDTTYNIFDDPAISVGIDLIVKYVELGQMASEYSTNIERYERELNAVIRRLYANRNFYPDANSTMRLSFGTVKGYSPFEGAKYNYYTTAKEILEKTKTYNNNPDFALEPELVTLLATSNDYSNSDGEMKVCFISNNDITGGNSGSAIFNDKGELIGLAFDGNWEAMHSDITYEPDVQRCIGVDVRYILFIIEKYGKARELIGELKIKGKQDG
ncbi:Dipeptidyl-peptidase 7 [termite gut metagenome]|uniref:Dipeptidyl-peptidase 7 n=1 Tax=termite gut metagenome TaxID=433724 RepID=A0A5J4SZZ1_9ZZZZ